ncbi:hypothetical protein D0Z00_003181 [Geotrichum galactomycetum]|uniref:Uncharacterized protein n=1 Tax=Geotrichum galactomycetum TaxID=27317 RepID=A0ACB6V230_9ASCO|nr:hypothetical protein D0Z00_003181 [Geotrichum candidum]
MTVVTSAQISYQNQPGYNDCLLPPTNASFLTPASKSSTTTTGASNTAASDESNENKVDLKDSIDAQLAKLLAMPTSLPAREFTHYKAKLTTNLPRDLPLVQAWLSALDECDADKAKQQEVRQQVIDYMLHHNGVSIWALPLRKVVESLVISDQ